MLTGPIDTVSNRATWIATGETYDPETNDPYDISEATEIVVSLRNPDSQTPELTASLTDATVEIMASEEDNVGNTVMSVFQWRFEASQMGNLEPRKTYELGVTITLPGEDVEDDTVQLVIGTVAILDGITEG